MKYTCRHFITLLIPCVLLGASTTYAQNKPARLISLNDQWKFSKDQSSSQSPSPNLNWQTLSLPHTWNATDVMDDEPGYYRGTGWYKRKLKLDADVKNKEVFLAFNGANQETEVYVNGKLAGSHIGGYTRFVVPVSSFLNYKDDEIEVKVTNRFNEDIAPLTADFTFFGGIYRNVDLLVTAPVHFAKNDHGNTSGVYLTTPDVSKETASLKAKSLIENASAEAVKVQVHTALTNADGVVVATNIATLTIPAHQKSTYVQDFKNIKNPQLWSAENPYLYRVITQLIDLKTKTVLDQVSNPLGFRWFKFDAEKGFFLNGEPVKLIGASRHQDYKGMGNAVPDALQIRDVELLKKMGGNFLRVSHYPQDPQILEACDRLGILASVEIPVVNTITESVAFTENCKNMQVEMIRQNFNHPSVVIWAYMNEILLRPKFADDKPRQAAYFKHIVTLAQTLDSLTRKEDPSRYTMIANHGSFDAYHKIGLTQIPMIVGWNLYSGWYSGNIEDFGKFLDRHHQELAGKPMLVTEYGADADPRIRSFIPVRFDKSVEYAIKFNQVYLNDIIKRPFVSGAMVWNLADFNSETREETMPHINNKGLLTLGREPKDIYLLYQAYLLKNPFLKIASGTWKIRTGTADSSKSYAAQPIQVTTNLKTAELFINGQSLGVKDAVDHVCSWEVPFVNGSNQLKVTSGAHSDELDVDFTLQPFKFSDQHVPFKEMNVLLGAKRFYIDETTHQIWMPDQPYKKGSWGYIGGEAFKGTNNRMSYGSDKNILETDSDPVYQTQQVGIEQFKLDVPDGEYELSLYFAELIGGVTKEALAYNLDNNHQKEVVKQRIFKVSVNGETFLENLNLAADYGYTTAVKKRTRITVQGGKGITLDFKTIEGVPVLNALGLRKIY
ncbi:glycoside hydrolase family 2 TIM barrel-domain containing protein [Pedobacter cryoconitis]|uniref:Beta-galactosidase n=1 Tax=Pedobacter cryoconitis TaxID=188932 RepID=A0A327S6Y8_9SPHI|nr:glycoside hydrolase family 2 TIM barrel-domain containing protein [Pedobacter cryoconitis]RAJ24661.1 beta-galactosidase [Pedobacter cryoconitis]